MQLDQLRPAPPSLPVDEATRRQFVAILSAAGLLTACGDDGPVQQGAAPTRSYTGRFGEVELPADPQRVVAMYSTGTDLALTLGLPIAAAPGADGTANTPFAAHQAAALEGIPPITASFEPDLEQIAAVRPDLILDDVYSPGDRAKYERLSAIAPVLTFGEEVTGWRDMLAATADALGRTADADGFVEQYEAAAARGRESLAGRWSGETFASVFVLPDQVIVAGADQLVHQILEQDLGMTLHPTAVRDGERTSLSLEEIGRLDADVLLFALGPRPDSLERDRTQITLLEASPLWRTLPAVASGRLVEYDNELTYESPLAAQALLAQLVGELTG